MDGSDPCPSLPSRPVFQAQHVSGAENGAERAENRLGLRIVNGDRHKLRLSQEA